VTRRRTPGDLAGDRLTTEPSPQAGGVNLPGPPGGNPHRHVVGTAQRHAEVRSENGGPVTPIGLL
jgi:hypothetical protein